MERGTNMTASFLVKEKGAANEYVVKKMLSCLKEIGHVGCNLVIRPDQEPPICACRTMVEHPPARSSGSNGIIERAIKEVEYHE